MDEQKKVYEVGVNFLASLPEEKVAEAYEEVKAVISKSGAEIISEEAPKLIDLAYSMVKHLAGKNVKYDTAYFAWVKFDISSEKIAEIKEALDQHGSILRSIIVKTVKENTLHGHKFAEEPKERSSRPSRRESPVAAPVEAPAEVVAPVMSAEAVDKAIDDLVTE